MQNRDALRNLILALPRPGGDVAAADVGSGAGEIVGWLIGHGYTTSGCELDPQRAAEAQRRHPPAVIACADASRWTPPQTPSLVTCIELIEHLPRDDQRLLLQRIGQWLPADGGTLVLSTPQRTSLVSLADRLYCRWKGLQYSWWDPTHISILPRRVLERDLTGSGFTIIDRIGIGLVPDVVTSHIGPLRRLVKDVGHRGLLGALAFDLVYICRRASTVPATPGAARPSRA